MCRAASPAPNGWRSLRGRCLVWRLLAATGQRLGPPVSTLGFAASSTPARRTASCGSAPRISQLVVDDGLRHAADVIAPREIRKLRRFDRDRRDVRAGERHLVREADRPRAVRSRRGREHLHRHRLVDRPPAAGRFASVRPVAAADQQHRLHERDELVAAPARRGTGSASRVGSPRSSSPTSAIAGTRSMPYCAALSRLEHEVDFLDRDLVGERRQLVEDLPAPGRTSRSRASA